VAPEYIDLLYRFLFFFGLFVIAGLGAPLPEEVLIVGAGIWTSQAGEFPLLRWLMLPVCIAGVIIADMLLYGIGRFSGETLLRFRWIARFYPKSKREKIERNFERHGVNILVFGRLLPGIRAPLFLTAGLMRLPFVRFLAADGIGAILGNSILFFLAFWFGDQFKELVAEGIDWVDRIKPLLIVVGLSAIALYGLYHFLRTPMPTGDPEELPPLVKQVAARIESGEIRITKKPEEPAKAEEPVNNGQATPSKTEHRPHIEGMESK
jgi:membrane protein DedA with SNARE-associated domain